MTARTPTTKDQAARIAAFCQAEITRRRLLAKNVLDRSQDEFCHKLTDVQYAALEVIEGGADDELNALISEVDYLPLYRAGSFGLGSVRLERAA